MVTVKAIPYSNFKEKINLVKDLLQEVNYIEINKGYIYTEKKYEGIDGHYKDKLC